MNKNPEVSEMIHEYLVKNGYDGLFEPGVCACLLEDLAPCGQIVDGCRAGYEQIQTLEDGKKDWSVGFDKEQTEAHHAPRN